jgi:hypothetical protein
MTASACRVSIEREEQFTSIFGELASAATRDGPPLQRSHKQVFVEWLSLPLNCQAAELQRYLEETDKDPVETLRCWMQDRWYERLVAKDARPSDRLLFISDMEILLPLLYEQAAGAPNSALFPGFLKWVKNIRRLPQKLVSCRPAGFNSL